ncbi:hypothetical protein NC981_14275 [Leptolyngbya sp. DQ-M1]|uniref:hypothetical protein n=1 Tax=Leptolyngbya sp. DQ-M1 TaxID=2933920 RepID=UPI00329A55C4
MHSDFRAIQASSPIATIRVDSDTTAISEGLIAIALPFSIFFAVLAHKKQKRQTLKRQIEMLERLWQKSSDRIQ